MFKAIKENKIIAINRVCDFPLLSYDEVIEDKEHDIEDYALTKDFTEYMLKSEIPEPPKEEKQAEVRTIRNQYLEKYVDPYQLVLRWNSLSDDEQFNIINYRDYLLNYTEEKDWWEQNPLTYDEWLESQEESS